MANPEIYHIIGFFLILFLIVLIFLAFLLEDDDKRNLVSDSGWFSVTFALIVIGLANPNINCSNNLVILIAGVLIVLLMILAISMLSKWHYICHGKIHRLKFINNSNKNIYIEVIPHAPRHKKLIDTIEIGQKIEYTCQGLIDIKFADYSKTNFDVSQDHIFVADQDTVRHLN